MAESEQKAVCLWVHSGAKMKWEDQQKICKVLLRKHNDWGKETDL